MPPRRAVAVLAAASLLGLAACCPVTAPPATAFVARLHALGGGKAVAHLQDGRELIVTGLTSVPDGAVYVLGRLLPDGEVAATSVRLLPAPDSATP
ncbi:MAG: hypothetical protein P8Z81_01220 [Deinococcales bacterium]